MSFDQFKAINPALCDARNNCRILVPGQVVPSAARRRCPDAPASPTQPAVGFAPQATP